jgi:hypothetical protein
LGAAGLVHWLASAAVQSPLTQFPPKPSVAQVSWAHVDASVQAPLELQ